MTHDWDVWFDEINIGRVYEEDQVPEGLPVIVLSKELATTPLLPRDLPVFKVRSGDRVFWMMSK
jgi:hypothetical protein